MFDSTVLCILRFYDIISPACSIAINTASPVKQKVVLESHQIVTGWESRQVINGGTSSRVINERESRQTR